MLKSVDRHLDRAPSDRDRPAVHGCGDLLPNGLMGVVRPWVAKLLTRGPNRDRAGARARAICRLASAGCAPSTSELQRPAQPHHHHHRPERGGKIDLVQFDFRSAAARAGRCSSKASITPDRRPTGCRRREWRDRSRSPTCSSSCRSPKTCGSHRRCSNACQGLAADLRKPYSRARVDELLERFQLAEKADFPVASFRMASSVGSRSRWRSPASRRC